MAGKTVKLPEIPTKEPAHVQDAQLTIHSGTFTGGINTIKNDDYGNLTITGGVL